MHASMSFDGGVRGGNPGHAGFAAVIDLAGEQHTIARPLRGPHTNNDAEYMGLIVGTKYAKYLGSDTIAIYSDSKLVVEQVNGRWQVKTESIRLLRREARDLLDKFYPGAWTLEWIPREQNTVADAACAKAVLCAMNPYRVNRLDPFSRGRTRTRLRGRSSYQ